MGRADDTGSFEEAFLVHFPVAKRAAARIVGSGVVAEDIAAEALARAFAHWDRLADSDYQAAWVVRVATNLALNSLRRPRTWVLPIEPVRRTQALDDRVADSVALAAALKRLPRRQREAVVLCHLEGFSETDVGRLLHVSANTVKTHVRRGLEALRGQFGESEGAVGWTT